jgi:hypothetical protein
MRVYAARNKSKETATETAQSTTILTKDFISGVKDKYVLESSQGSFDQLFHITINLKLLANVSKISAWKTSLIDNKISHLMAIFNYGFL